MSQFYTLEQKFQQILMEIIAFSYMLWKDSSSTFDNSKLSKIGECPNRNLTLILYHLLTLSRRDLIWLMAKMYHDQIMKHCRTV